MKCKEPDAGVKLFANDRSARYCQPGGRSVMRFRMPNGLSKQQLKEIGSRGASVVERYFGSEPVYIVGIASRGLPIASAITLMLNADNTFFSIIQDSWQDDKVDVYLDTHRFILVDNTIKTGRTIETIAPLLSLKKIEISLLISFYHDDLDANMERHICDLLNIEPQQITRLFSREEARMVISNCLPGEDNR